MNIETTTFSEQIGYIKEDSDLDEMIFAYEKWLNKGCITVIIVACLYFFPAMIKALLK